MIIAFDNLIGSNHGDILVGDRISNSLIGLGVNDLLQDNQGEDTLTGGHGTDIFSFDNSSFLWIPADERDVITDFS